MSSAVGSASGIEEREHAAVLRHREVAEREHQTGHRQRQHRERIEQRAAGQGGAHDDVGDRHAEHEIDDRREARVFQAS